MNGGGTKYLEGTTNSDDGYGHAGNTGRHLTGDIDTISSGFFQEALVPLNSETHGGEDVAIYASGPGAHLVTGTHEQNVIFHIMDHAGNLRR